MKKNEARMGTRLLPQLLPGPGKLSIRPPQSKNPPAVPVRTKKWPTSHLGEWVTDMHLPHYGVYCVCITEQTIAKCNLFVLYNKNVKNFAKISFVVWRKDFSTSFDVIMVHTKQSTPLAIDNSKIAVIRLSLKWRQRASVL